MGCLNGDGVLDVSVVFVFLFKCKGMSGWDGVSVIEVCDW